MKVTVYFKTGQEIEFNGTLCAEDAMEFHTLIQREDGTQVWIAKNEYYYAAESK